ncbi:MAG TPA: hypothetical protein VIW78_07415 [Burkholderiales bacterium]
MGGALALAGCGEQVPSQAVAQQGVLCSNDFQACVMPVLSGQIRRQDGATVSCMNSTCHLAGGNGGRFTLSATDANADMQVVTTLADLENPHASPVLAKPAEEVTHGGGRVLSGRGDSCYLAIYNWISTKGDPVLGDASPSCGKCVPVANTSTDCGFP